MTSLGYNELRFLLFAWHLDHIKQHQMTWYKYSVSFSHIDDAGIQTVLYPIFNIMSPRQSSLHFQMNYLEWKLSDFHFYFAEVLS